MESLILKGRVATAKYDRHNSQKATKKYGTDAIKGYSIFLHIFEVDGKPVVNPEMQTEGRYYPDYLLVDLIAYADEEIVDEEGRITYLNLVHPLPIERWDEDYSLPVSFSPQKSIVVLQCSAIYTQLLKLEETKGILPARAGKDFKRGAGQPERKADIIHRLNQAIVLDEYLPSMRVLNNPAPVNVPVTIPSPSFSSNGLTSAKEVN